MYVDPAPAFERGDYLVFAMGINDFAMISEPYPDFSSIDINAMLRRIKQIIQWYKKKVNSNHIIFVTSYPPALNKRGVPTRKGVDLK